MAPRIFGVLSLHSSTGITVPCFFSCYGNDKKLIGVRRVAMVIVMSFVVASNIRSRRAGT